MDPVCLARWDIMIWRVSSRSSSEEVAEIAGTASVLVAALGWIERDGTALEWIGAKDWHGVRVDRRRASTDVDAFIVVGLKVRVKV